MDRAEREQHLQDVREKLIREYPEAWARMIRKFNESGPECSFRLMSSAGYLFRTGSTIWAVDPVRLHTRIPETDFIPPPSDLSNLDVVILTHAHEDHLDRELYNGLAQYDTLWIIPAHVKDKFLESGASAGKMITVENDKELSAAGLTIIPFEGKHFETMPDGGIHGIEAAGYLVESGGKRFLFPGDTREYYPEHISVFQNIDAIFAHVFLGRSECLEDDPSLLDDFCEYCSACNPSTVFLSHLYELGREAEDCWVKLHGEMVQEKLGEIDPGIKTVIPEWFRKYSL